MATSYNAARRLAARALAGVARITRRLNRLRRYHFHPMIRLNTGHADPPSLAGWTLLLGVTCVGAESAHPPLHEIDFEQLMEIEITTASRKLQPINQTAAAAFVITADDIRRSGARSIPEALRLAPGIEVAQISPSKWSVTIRGFSGRWANKLLVLVDGRSVYTPSFGGVYWELQDVLLDDVARIEVIRGPGATLWGANAVNGVINIITYSAAETPGGLVEVTNSAPFKSASARWGGKLGENGSYRFSLKTDHGSGTDSYWSPPLPNDYGRRSLGFRVEGYGTEKDFFSLTGNLTDLDQGQQGWHATGATGQTLHQKNPARAANLVARWEHSLSVDSETTLQLSLDRHTAEEISLKERRNTFDVDFQHHFSMAARHEVVWGLNYRLSIDDTESKRDDFGVRPGSERLHTLSAFFQDEIELVEDAFWIDLGAKLEHNDYVGYVWQPNVRALWKPTQDQSVWASVARAARMPTRQDRGYQARIAFFRGPSEANPLPYDIGLVMGASPEFGSELLTAFELGYRVRPLPDLVVDAAVFLNRYSDLRDAEFDSLYVDDDRLNALFRIVNGISGNTYGFELTTDWRPSNQWRFQLSYSYLQFDLESEATADPWVFPDSASVYSGYSPTQQASIRASWTPRADLDLDLWLRAVDELPTTDFMQFDGVRKIEAYFALDARIAWRPSRLIELALIGKNLLDPQHLEYVQEFWSEAAMVPRSLMVSARIDY